MKFSKLFIIILLTTSVRTIFSSQPMLSLQPIVATQPLAGSDDIQAAQLLESFANSASACTQEVAPSQTNYAPIRKTRLNIRVNPLMNWPTRYSPEVFDLWNEIIRTPAAHRDFGPLCQSIKKYKGELSQEKLTGELLEYQDRVRANASDQQKNFQRTAIGIEKVIAINEFFKDGNPPTMVEKIKQKDLLQALYKKKSKK